MKTQLLLLGALLTAALACESSDGVVASDNGGVRLHVLAATQSGKSAPTKQAPTTAPSTPAPKPAEKERTARPARPAYLFL